MPEVTSECPICKEIVVRREQYIGDREIFNQKLDVRSVMRHLEEKHRNHPEFNKFYKKLEEEEKNLDCMLAEVYPY